MHRARPPSLLLATCLALATANGARAGEPEAAPPAEALGAQPATQERETAYRAFRREFDAGRYAEALPQAERVVALTEALDAHHPDLARALNNLAATEYRLGDFIAAEKTYGRALVLLEDAHGSSATRLIAPLRGLALTYQASGRHELAVPLLERALAISRHSKGLFNPEQQTLLTPLAESYVALARWKDANAVQLYALQVSEHEYGASDPRMFAALEQLGRWYASTAQRYAARDTWERLLALCSAREHPDPIGQIVALRGIATAYRLDYQLGPEPVAPRPGDGAPRRELVDLDPGWHTPSSLGPQYVLSSAGQEALEQALAIAEKLRPPAPTALAVVLVDLGDWHQIADRLDRALPYYRRALPLTPAEQGGPETVQGALSGPVLLLYRQPPSAARHRDQPASQFVEQYAVAEFTVTAEGHVRDAKVVEGDATDSQRSGFLGALARAIYRPRFVDGKPVATDKVRLRETFRHPKG